MHNGSVQQSDAALDATHELWVAPLASKKRVSGGGQQKAQGRCGGCRRPSLSADFVEDGRNTYESGAVS